MKPKEKEVLDLDNIVNSSSERESLDNKWATGKKKQKTEAKTTKKSKK